MLVCAWHLTEGDQTLGGETVVALYRDAPRHRITVAWTSGERAEFDGDNWVPITRRAVDIAAGVVTLRHRHPGMPIADVLLTPRERDAAPRRLDDRRSEPRRL